MKSSLPKPIRWIGVVTGMLMWGCGHEGPSPEPVGQFNEAVGVMLGGEVANAIPRGGRVLVLHPNRAVSDRVERIIEGQISGLKQALPSGQYILTVVELGEPQGETGYEISAENLRTHLSRGRFDAVILVETLLFGGVPGAPPLFMSGHPSPGQAQSLLTSGGVQAVVMPSENADWSKIPAEDAPPDTVFDLRYEMWQR